MSNIILVLWLLLFGAVVVILLVYGGVLAFTNENKHLGVDVNLDNFDKMVYDVKEKIPVEVNLKPTQ